MNSRPTPLTTFTRLMTVAAAAVLFGGLTPATAQVTGKPALVADNNAADGNKDSSNKNYESKYRRDRNGDIIRDNRNYDGRYNDNYNRNDYRLITCESRKQRYRECSVTGKYRNIQFHRRLSKSNCRQGKDWGIKGNKVWVDRGCRAQFQVSYTNNRNYGYNDRDRDYDRNRGYDRDRSYGNNGYGNSRYYSQRDAVNSCVNRAQQRLRYDGYKRARLSEVRRVRERNGNYTIKLIMRADGRYGTEYCPVSCSSNYRSTQINI